jgi:hypothetical protein
LTRRPAPSTSRWTFSPSSLPPSAGDDDVLQRAGAGGRRRLRNTDAPQACRSALVARKGRLVDRRCGPPDR